MLLINVLRQYRNTFVKDAIELQVKSHEYFEFTDQKRTPEELDIIRHNFNSFVDMLLTLKPDLGEEGHTIIAYRYKDVFDDNENILESTAVYKTKELQDYSIMHDILELHANSMTEEEIQMWTDKIREHDYITSWGFEFEPWEVWLGMDVFVPSFERVGFAECISDVLTEMTFNGMTRESQQERREELEESAKNAQDIMDMPEEEREQHLISWDEVKQELEANWSEEEKKEEKEKTDKIRKRMNRVGLWNRVHIERAIYRYQQKIKKLG